MNQPFSLPNVADSLNFVKNLWGNFGLPNAVAPTMDIDELDKRIADLKAVEQWLNLNLNMLRGTIQGMEVQRGTIAALKSFGNAFRNTGDFAEAAEQTVKKAGAVLSPDWSTFIPSAARQDAAPAGKTDSKRTRMPEPEPEPEPEMEPDMPPDPMDAAPPEPVATDGKPTKAPKANRKATDKPDGLVGAVTDAASQLVNPAAWFNLLQEQFTQVAGAAMAAAAAGAAEEDGKKPGARASRKTGASGKAGAATPGDAAPSRAASKARSGSRKATGSAAGSSKSTAARSSTRKR